MTENISSNLGYLTAAYSVIWVVIAFYLAILILRNRSLLKHVAELEERIDRLENEDRASGSQ